MCGIFAMFSPNRPVLADTLSRALRALEHRGPDGSGMWVAPDQTIGLAHSRLSIIDLRSGAQPLVNEDGQMHAVVNGEFYDFEKVRQQLKAQGHQLRTQVDSEILLHLYEEHGVAALAHLRGEFAFVLWDQRRRHLFAGRDRFGIKPLYYAQHAGVLYLASEAKALFAAGVPARWDRWSLYQACHFYYDQRRTLFEGVHQIPPGHYVIADENGITVQRYWDLEFPCAQAADTVVDETESIAQVRAAIEQAVRIRLRADVPVAFYLSGGIDSAAIVGLAAPHLSRPADAFTICFDDEAYNEGALARQTAEHVGVNYRPITVGHDDLADAFVHATWHSETINPNTNGVAKYLLSRAVRDAGYKVVLTGEGADEVFCGYSFLVREMLVHERHDPEAKAALLALKGPGLPRTLLAADSPKFAEVSRLLGFVPSFFQAHDEQVESLAALFEPDHAAAFSTRCAFSELVRGLDVAGQLSGRSKVYQSLYIWLKSMFPNFLLNQLADRMEMAHSLEGRVPFLDHHLVETLRTIPLSLKIHGTIEKYALRQAARHVLTDTVYQRKKHAFWAPPSASSTQGRLHQLFQDTVRSAAANDLPLFSRASVLAFLDRMPNAQVDGPHAVQGASAALTLLASVTALHVQYGLT